MGITRPESRTSSLRTPASFVSSTPGRHPGEMSPTNTTAPQRRRGGRGRTSSHITIELSGGAAKASPKPVRCKNMSSLHGVSAPSTPTQSYRAQCAYRENYSRDELVRAFGPAGVPPWCAKIPSRWFGQAPPSCQKSVDAAKARHADVSLSMRAFFSAIRASVSGPSGNRSGGSAALTISKIA